MIGLMPILWASSTQIGADVMKRIAAPMVGGVLTSGLMELLVYPVIYFLWRGRKLEPTLEPTGTGKIEEGEGQLLPAQN